MVPHDSRQFTVFKTPMADRVVVVRTVEVLAAVVAPVVVDAAAVVVAPVAVDSAAGTVAVGIVPAPVVNAAWVVSSLIGFAVVMMPPDVDTAVEDAVITHQHHASYSSRTVSPKHTPISDHIACGGRFRGHAVHQAPGAVVRKTTFC